MRLVFWLFLLLNIAFFYWQYSQPKKSETPPPVAEAVPEGVERLVLLRERGLSAPPAKTVRKESRKQVVTSGEPAPAVPTEPSAPQPLKETAIPPVGRGEPRVKPVPPKQPAPPPVMACFTLGPFKDESDAGQMYKSLRRLGVTVEQRLVERRIPRGYWVYLPPQKSYSAARQKVRELEKMGLDDLYIMGKGEMKNAISLGLFTRKSTATERFNQVRRLDSSTVMKRQYRTIKEKWLDLRIDSGRTDAIADIAALADRHDVELAQQKACK